MKVLHVLYSSLPSVTGGDIRSRDIVVSQMRAQIKPIVITSPFQKGNLEDQEVENIDDIQYYRTYSVDSKLRIEERYSGLGTKFMKLSTLPRFVKAIYTVARENKVELIHAHSTFFCALAGRFAANKLDVPLVYEVRSLWELRAVMQKPNVFRKLLSKIITRLETIAMKSADHVVVINKGLKIELLKRGVKKEDLTIVGNAVDTNLPKTTCPSISSKTADQWVFGYVGNISDIEGIDLLLDSVDLLRSKGVANSFLIWGSGPAYEKLRTRASRIENVYFMGKFQRNMVDEVYDSVDVIINPRTKSDLTDKVTPLKPLEAMYYRKPVIVSSVGGMLELVKHGQNGFVFECGNKDSLAETILDLMSNESTLAPIMDNAYSFVITQKSWDANAKLYQNLYERLTKQEVNEL